jgi:hypothetical protein
MDFKIGEGFRVEGVDASLNLADQTDDVIRAAYEEARAVGEAKGLWTPADAGSVAVGAEVAAPTGTPEDEAHEEEQSAERPLNRDYLLATAVDGAKLYIATIAGINAGRGRKDKIPTLKPEEYREQAEDWLTDRRKLTALKLPATALRPRIITPRLNRAITREENVEAWKAAAGGNLWSWRGRMKFLDQWTENELSGFEPALEDETPFMILPTAYDARREGNVDTQTGALNQLQQQYSEIDVATVFDGVLLARRYMGQDRNWQDSYVRAINLEPKKVGLVVPHRCVPYAHVYGDGDAGVDYSSVRRGDAARLRVR